MRENGNDDVETSPPPPYVENAEKDPRHAPEESAQSRESRVWWRRKLCWILLLAVVGLVLFAIIFGAVFGVKKSRSRSVHDSWNVGMMN